MMNVFRNFLLELPVWKSSTKFPPKLSVVSTTACFQLEKIRKNLARSFHRNFVTGLPIGRRLAGFSLCDATGTCRLVASLEFSPEIIFLQKSPLLAMNEAATRNFLKKPSPRKPGHLIHFNSFYANRKTETLVSSMQSSKKHILDALSLQRERERERMLI